MTAHGTAVRALGIISIVYALLLAWMPITLFRSASQMGDVMFEIAGANPATAEQLAEAGRTPEDLRDALGATFRKEALAEVAPELAVDAIALAAGLLLVFRRRVGAWLLLAFLAWPAAVAGYRWLREALNPVKMKLQLLAEPLVVSKVRFDALGGTWEVELGAFLLTVRLAFTALALAILVWWLLAARRARRAPELA